MGVTRRRLVRGTAALLGGAGLAGCAGGEGGEEAPDVAEFREMITAELAVSLERLERSGGTVLVNYRSNHETETEQWGYEVGFISGRFGRLVADGWDVTRLDGTVTGREGRTLSWRLSAETAGAFARDEITAEEFVTAIFDGMSES